MQPVVEYNELQMSGQILEFISYLPYIPIGLKELILIPNTMKLSLISAAVTTGLPAVRPSIPAIPAYPPFLPPEIPESGSRFQ